jgi:F-type H+-transporting ATPase subunit b
MKMFALGCRPLKRVAAFAACLSLISTRYAFGAGGLISIDSTLFIQIVNFLVLIFLLNIVLYRPIRRILIERKEKFGGLEKTIENTLKDAQGKEDEFARGLREAKSNGLKEKESRIAAATEEERRIIGEINEKAQENLLQIRAKIEKDTEAVRTSLKDQVDDFAKAIGQKILGRAV